MGGGSINQPKAGTGGTPMSPYPFSAGTGGTPMSPYPFSAGTGGTPAGDPFQQILNELMSPRRGGGGRSLYPTSMQ